MSGTKLVGNAADRRRPNQDDVTALYESRFASTYDLRATCWERTISRKSSRRFHRQLQDLPAGPLQVLDIGCGTGRNLHRLHAAGVAVTTYRGIDGSKTMLAAAERHLGDRRSEFDHVERLIAETNHTYDLVLCTWVLSHLTDPAKLLKHALNLLNPGGSLLVAALTSTTHPVGAMIGRNYSRRLHAVPIDLSVLTGARPTHLHSGLFGLTTVASYRNATR